MMAFDILIFNYDRLPCVFQNGGNTENIMISEARRPCGARPPATNRRTPNLPLLTLPGPVAAAQEGQVVAIDSMISGFDISNYHAHQYVGWRLEPRPQGASSARRRRASSAAGGHAARPREPPRRAA